MFDCLGDEERDFEAIIFTIIFQVRFFECTDDNGAKERGLEGARGDQRRLAIVWWSVESRCAPLGDRESKGYERFSVVTVC